MRIQNLYFLLPLLALTLTLLSSSCDDDMPVPMAPTVNRTTVIIGSYTGTNLFGEDGSSFTEEDRRATATRTTDSTATLSVRSVLAGTLDLMVTMDTDTTFRVGNINIFDEGPYSGAGTVDDAGISVQLATSDSKRYTYEGVRE